MLSYSKQKTSQLVVSIGSFNSINRTLRSRFFKFVVSIGHSLVEACSINRTHIIELYHLYEGFKGMLLFLAVRFTGVNF